MSASPASLISFPMYDWPEVKDAHDLLFDLLSDKLKSAGYQPPNSLSQASDPVEIWTSPYLLLTQTCGLPFKKFLENRTCLIGSPIYDLDCPDGYYYSVIITKKGTTFKNLTSLRKTKFGCNEFGSQSGYACLQSHLISRGVPPIDPISVIPTGSHRQSIQAVAEGRVDYAAIDIVSWKLALDHEAACAEVQVIGKTDPRPTLPFITSLIHLHERGKLARCLAEAIDALSSEAQKALHLKGFVDNTLSRYQIIIDDYHLIEKCRNKL